MINSLGALTFTFIKTLNDFRYNMTPQTDNRKNENFLKQNGYSQIPFGNVCKHILNNLLMGDDKDFKPNVNIYLEGDKWCKEETQWNIYDLQKNQLLSLRIEDFLWRMKK